MWKPTIGTNQNLNVYLFLTCQVYKLTPTPKCMSSCLVVVDLAVRKESYGSRGCFVLDLFFAEPTQNLDGRFCGRLLFCDEFRRQCILQKKMEAVWTIASKYNSATNPQKGVFPLLLWLLVQKKTSYPFSVFFLYFVKFQNLAVLASQYCSNNAKNSPFQAFRWWGASSVSPSRPTIWTPGRGYAKNGSLFCCDVIEGDRFYSSNISFASSTGVWIFTQGRARNASNTRMTGDEAQGTMGRRKKRSASFLLLAFVCSQILLREIDVDVWVWGRSLEVWAVLYKQYSRSPKRYSGS